MKESSRWHIGGVVLFMLSVSAGQLGAPDAKVAAAYVVTAIAIATSTILRALGK